MKITNALFLLFLAPLLLCAPLQAGPPAGAFAALPPTEQEKQAPALLGSATTKDGNVFAMGGIGFAGTRPDKYVAYEAILRRKDATAVFQKLLASPNAVTQLYALTGLAKTAPATFRALAPRYRKRRDTVKMMSGCIAFARPFADAVQDLLVGESPATYRSKPRPRD